MKNIDRKKLGIAIGVVVLGFLLFRMLSAPPATKLAGGFNFHPDSVVGFTWTVGEQNFSFQRPDRSRPWTPAVDANNLQKKLNALATVALRDMKAPGEGLSIEIVFGPDNKWKGVYRDGRFVWTEGLHKDEGFRADANWAKIFEEGRFAFDKHEWSWCEARPQRLVVDSDPPLNFELYQKNRGWVLKQGKQELLMDPTAIEKWLGHACQAPVDFYRDLKNYPMGLFKGRGHFRVEFVPGGPAAKDFQRKDDFWMIDQEKAAQSSALVAALVELTLLPHQPMPAH